MFFWLVSLVISGWMTVQICRGFSLRRVSMTASDESGASYSLGWVMTLPFYIVFVGFTTECTLLMVAKAGSVYSAYAGARTAIVWNGVEDGNMQTLQRAREAAQQAFVPFANGTRRVHRTINAAQASGWHRAYTRAHNDFSTKPASSRFLFAKMKDSTDSLSVTLSSPTDFLDDIRCKVEYRYRFHVPIVGNILGSQGGDGYYTRPIVSEVSLQNEGLQNASGRLGIAFLGP
ncbi:hypothetical protein SH668x_001749 [Planctomicrobium sp. SH668]|uniref:hypothetical protein n=1 Tax=Planctomicrobium sp. SH668 TaxID=3448126 RepID=UPI003F5B3759